MHHGERRNNWASRTCNLVRQVADGRDNMQRGGTIGPHAHGNAARRVVGGLSECLFFFRKAPVGVEHALSCLTVQLTRHLTFGPGVVLLVYLFAIVWWATGTQRGVGSKNRKTTPTPTSTTPSMPTTGLRYRGNDSTRNSGHSGRQKALTRCSTRREERVTVQGPIKKPQPDGMSHRRQWVRGSVCWSGKSTKW